MKEMIVQEVKVTRNYQITIPKAIAEKLGIKIGDKVIIIYDNGKITINKKKTRVRDLAGKIKSLPITSKDLDEEIGKAISELTDQIEKERE